MILMAVGLPAFLRAYHAYELSNAARQVGDILRLARYEAIRLNTPVPCVIQASSSNPGYTNMWVDSNSNGKLDATEKVVLLEPSGNLVDGGSVPGKSSLISAAVNTVVPSAPSPSSSSVKFDARGAVIPPSTVNVFYLSSALAPEAGYRFDGHARDQIVAEVYARRLDSNLDGRRFGKLATAAVRIR
jgi:hypothetical protein